MGVNKIYQGDALSVLQTFPDNTIDMCMTSPPYWGLRDYGVEQVFPDGSKGQLGLEPTPEQYIQHMTEIFHEVKRVLKKIGTLWVVIGDTYGGSCQGGGDTGLSKKRYRKELLTYRDKPQKKMMPKCLMMIPERLAWSMIQDGWILRNKNIWYKHNNMPESVKDRFSNKYEFVYMFSQSKKYYFDLDAVREKHKEAAVERYKRKWNGNGNRDYPNGPQNHMKNFMNNEEAKARALEAGKNPGDVFEINTQPFPKAHFAVYPVKLCEKPIRAGCKKGGIVLDLFSGAGTTCYAAAKLGRDFIGIEISEKYKAMSENRIFGSLFK